MKGDRIDTKVYNCNRINSCYYGNGIERRKSAMKNRILKITLLSLMIFVMIFGGITLAYAYDKIHVVSKGESLYLIAKWYGSDVNSIKEVNGKWSDLIYPGEKLVVPVNVNTAYYNYLVDRYLIAKMIYAEARGESLEGQVAVGAVILNRVKSNIFPDTVAGVIYQPDAFESITNGEFFNHEPDLTAFKAADLALAGWDPTGGALYFFNPATSTSWWIWTRTVTNVIGNHWFAI
jgi:N-acetylmuramoyl-L-alanine amidase